VTTASSYRRPEVQVKSTKTTLNPEKPVLYVTTVENGALIIDQKNDRVLRINAIAFEIWKLLSAGRSENDTAATVAEKYNMESKRVADDLRQLLSQLAEHHLVVDSHLLMSNEDDGVHSHHQVPALNSEIQKAQDSLSPRRLLALKAFAGIALFDAMISLGSLRIILDAIAKWPTKPQIIRDKARSIAEVSVAVNRACVWYPKRALCLQRAVVIVCLLRDRGLSANLVIGARPVPFLAHAWVEVDGAVVNDFARVREFYGTLMRV
jgi:hypothetical protein